MASGSNGSGNAKHSNRKRPQTGSLNARLSNSSKTAKIDGVNTQPVINNSMPEKRSHSGTNQRLSANKF